MFARLLVFVMVVCSPTLSAAAPDLSRLKSAVRGNVGMENVKPSAVDGLHEVTVGSQILYLSDDGRYAIEGDVIDLDAGSNLTELRRDQLRFDAVNAVGEEEMVVFAPSTPAKHTVTVFTDIDCVYCRKLHSEIADYNRAGIKVRYLMYPRAGIGSESYQKAVSVWCADDRQEAMTHAKLGDTVPTKSCANPIKEQYDLGQAIGVRGTPAIVLEDGRMLPGYLSSERLAQILDGAPIN